MILAVSGEHGRMKMILRLALVPLAMMLAAAAPPATRIPHPQYPRHILVIPNDSPVKFKSWEDGVATFEGHFVVTGGWSYGCAFDCGDPPEQAYFQFELKPEPEIATRLPHWTSAGQSEDYGFGDHSIMIMREEKLVERVVEPALAAALRSDKVPYVQGRVSIVVEDFRTGFSCDSSYYSASFVAMAETAKLAKVEPSGVGTCG